MQNLYHFVLWLHLQPTNKWVAAWVEDVFQVVLSPFPHPVN